mgnify:CR=1 FL=1
MRSSFFITSGENQILYIVQCLGLAFFVQLVEVVQQGSLGGGIVLPRWCLPHWRGYFWALKKRVNGCINSLVLGQTINRLAVLCNDSRVNEGDAAQIAITSATTLSIKIVQSENFIFQFVCKRKIEGLISTLDAISKLFVFMILEIVHKSNCFTFHHNGDSFHNGVIIYSGLRSITV